LPVWIKYNMCIVCIITEINSHPSVFNIVNLNVGNVLKIVNGVHLSLSVMLRHMIPAGLWYDGWRATWSRWSASADFKLSISLRIQCFRSGGSNQQLSVRRMSVYIDRFYSARSLCIYCCFLPRKSLYC
jgi:hypothetical protein